MNNDEKPEGAGISPLLDNSIKDEYHTQINNKIIPWSACNPTSQIMYLKYNNLFDRINWERLYPNLAQPEDKLTQYVLDNADRLAKIYVPWFYDPEKQKCTIQPPVRVHSIVAAAINEIAEKHITRFVENYPLQSLILGLDNGKSFVLNGLFQHYEYTHIDHCIVLCGKSADNQRFLIDDPVGDPRTEYRSQKGNNIQFTRELLIQCCHSRGHETFWAHVPGEV